MSKEDLYSANIMRGSKHVCVNSLAPLLCARQRINVSNWTAFAGFTCPTAASESRLEKGEHEHVVYLVRLTVVPRGRRDLRHVSRHLRLTMTPSCLCQ